MKNKKNKKKKSRVRIQNDMYGAVFLTVILLVGNGLFFWWAGFFEREKQMQVEVVKEVGKVVEAVENSNDKRFVQGQFYINATKSGPIVVEHKLGKIPRMVTILASCYNDEKYNFKTMSWGSAVGTGGADQSSQMHFSDFDNDHTVVADRSDSIVFLEYAEDFPPDQFRVRLSELTERTFVLYIEDTFAPNLCKVDKIRFEYILYY